MLRPLAYCVWANPALLNAVLLQVGARERLDSLQAYVRWLLQRSNGPSGFLNFVQLPLVVNEVLWAADDTRAVAVRH